MHSIFFRLNTELKTVASVSRGSDFLKKDIRQDIQGLRAIAVLAVILFHTNKNWLPGGFIGVDIFLVISGFLITSIVLEKKDSQRFGWLDFYWGRIKRILPAYYVLLVVVSLAAALLFIPEDFRFYKESLSPSLYFSSNQYFSEFGDYFAPLSYELPLLHTWSLAVEMQFYLILPILLIWLPLRWVKVIIPVLLLAITAYVEYAIRVKGQQQEMYFSLLARMPEFFLGATVAIFRVGETWSLKLSNLFAGLGCLFLALSFYFINESIGFPGATALVPCTGAVLLIAARNTIFSQILSMGALVWIGSLSYSLYLWHWPILSFFRYYIGSYALELPWLILFALLTFVFAWLSFHWIEEPFRRTKNYSQGIKRFSLLVACMLPTVAFSKDINLKLVEPLSVELTRYASPDEICHGQIIGDCVRGTGGGKPSILVLGDSHAAMLNFFFDVVGMANNSNMRVITGSGCVPIHGFDVKRLPKWAQAACAAQIEAAKKFIDNASTIIIAGKWQSQVKSKKFISAFDDFLQAMTLQEKKVVVMAQVPMFSSNPRRLRRFRELYLPVETIQNVEWVAANEEISSITNKYPHTYFFDLSKSSFFTQAPFYKGMLIYQDKHHLNEVGSLRYGEYAAPFFKKLMVQISER